jgi:hypothetical protein
MLVADDKTNHCWQAILGRGQVIKTQRDLQSLNRLMELGTQQPCWRRMARETGLSRDVEGALLD